jgi:hypothetical protein
MENQAKYINFHKTKDQYISALFFSMGLKLEDTYREGQTVFFVWEDREKCEEIEKLYYQNRLKINPKNYVEGLITIKHLIFGK